MKERSKDLVEFLAGSWDNFVVVGKIIPSPPHAYRSSSGYISPVVHGIHTAVPCQTFNRHTYIQRAPIGLFAICAWTKGGSSCRQYAAVLGFSQRIFMMSLLRLLVCVYQAGLLGVCVCQPALIRRLPLHGCAQHICCPCRCLCHLATRKLVLSPVG